MFVKLYEGYYLNLDNVLVISNCTLTFVNGSTSNLGKKYIKIILDAIEREGK